MPKPNYLLPSFPRRRESIWGLLKKAVSCVLIAQWTRKGRALRDPLTAFKLYASSSSRLAALLIVLFEQPLAFIWASLKGVGELGRSWRITELFNTLICGFLLMDTR